MKKIKNVAYLKNLRKTKLGLYNLDRYIFFILYKSYIGFNPA